MSTYLILAYESPTDFASLSPEEMQGIIARYIAWTETVKAKGALLDSAKLKDREGRILRHSGNKLVVTDGPYAETREVIGGFWLIEADDYQAVVDLCDGHPHLAYGGTLSVRAIEG